jgi:hypothetical protein
MITREQKNDPLYTVQPASAEEVKNLVTGMQELVFLCKTAQQVLEQTTKQRDEAVQKLNENSELLNQATEDINVLLAFIKSRGLQPPKHFAA